jgi:hypothetical protein
VIVVPPFLVQQRAWECAYVLREEHDERLPLADRVRCEEVLRAGPDALGWQDVQAMLRLAGEAIGARV